MMNKEENKEITRVMTRKRMVKRNKYTEKIYNLFNSNEAMEQMTMSEIAVKIGVTKMTLYNNFKDKNDIIEAVIRYRSSKYKEFLKKMQHDDYNAIDVLMGVLRFQRENPLPMMSRLYKQLYINFPEKFETYINVFKNSLQDFIRNNIIEGQNQGVYRSDVDAVHISAYLKVTIDGMFDKMLNNRTDEAQSDLNEVHRDVIMYHIRGIISPKGEKILTNYLKKV